MALFGKIPLAIRKMMKRMMMTNSNLGMIAVAGLIIWGVMSQKGGGLSDPDKAGINQILDDLKRGTVPAWFTASSVDLALLEAAGYKKGSAVYQQALDYAYLKAQEQATRDTIQTGVKHYVGWSSAKGYYSTSEFYY